MLSETKENVVTVCRPTVDYFKLVRPCFGETASGDAAIVTQTESGVFMGIVDVLGHGDDAHRLACVIECFLSEHGSADLVDTLWRLHAHLRGTRGAGAGLCWLDLASGLLRYTGIGNTVTRTFGSRQVRLPSKDGIVGAHPRAPREERLQLARGDVVVLYTDGVRDHFQLEAYPQLLVDSAHSIATTILRRFGKPHDDASCIALRYL